MAGAIGCSDPATLPPKAAMAIDLGPPAAGTTGGCPTQHAYSIPDNEFSDIMNTGSPDVRVTDGKNDVSVDCRVADSGGTFSIFGQIKKTGANFAVSGEGITESGGGMASIAEKDPNSIQGSGVCALTVKSLHGGAIWAQFQCDAFNENNGLGRCSSNGAFIFENCQK